FGVVVNISCAVLFIKVLKMNIGGLALASAISSVAIAVSLLFMINKRRKGIITKMFLINIFKTVIMGVLAFLVAKFIYGGIENINIFGDGMIETLIKLCISAIPAMIMYILAAFVLKADEVKVLANKIHKGGDN
ncbi:MAG: hypothetical protein RSA27_04720, partial [Oscillospiraceae bacterium]